MYVNDLIRVIDETVPFSLSENWDNCGLIVGENEMPVSNICLTLDATPEIIDQAEEMNCNVIITHHPLIFNPIINVDTSSLTGAVIKRAMKKDIAIISLHTNWDKSGLNIALASALKLNNIRTLQPMKKDEERFGVMGELPQKENLDNFLKIIKDAWELTYVICHEAKRKNGISTVALCGGAGGEFWLDALNENADVFITAEVKRFQHLEAAYKGLHIVEADHYEMESYSLKSLGKLLSETTNIDINIINPYININVLA